MPAQIKCTMKDFLKHWPQHGGSWQGSVILSCPLQDSSHSVGPQWSGLVLVPAPHVTLQLPQNPQKLQFAVNVNNKTSLCTTREKVAECKCDADASTHFNFASHLLGGQNVNLCSRWYFSFFPIDMSYTTGKVRFFSFLPCRYNDS